MRDSRLPRGNVNRAGQMTLLPLVLLAHIDEQRSVDVVESREDVGRGDLVDLVLDLGEQLSVGGHYFPEYSVWPPAQAMSRPSIETPLFHGFR